MRTGFQIAVMLMLCTVAKAQWECPSQLGGSLKPVGTSSLMWAGEITGSMGGVYKNTISNLMGFAALDYSTTHQTFYAEGGYKYWVRNDLGLNQTFSNSHWGIRELYYQNKSSLGEITLGIQSISSADAFLVNERMAGLNYKGETNSWSYQLSGGTVTRDFARNGAFCSKGYLYDIIPDRTHGLLGNRPGDTNFALATISHSFKASSNHTDSSDEFSSPNNTLESKFTVNALGALIYSEFGQWIDNNSLIAGIYSDMKWRNVVDIKPEVLYQTGSNNRAVIYKLAINKELEGNNGRFTSLTARYIGLSAIDNNASADISYANLMAGEVIRLDTPDLPIMQLGVKQRFTRSKTHIKLQYSKQFEAGQLNEFDFEIGKKLWNKLSVNAQYGYINSDNINTQMVRTELRLTF